MLSKVTQTFNSVLGKIKILCYKSHEGLSLLMLTMQLWCMRMHLLYLKCIDQWTHWPWAASVTIPRPCTWSPPPQEQSDSQQQTSSILCFVGGRKKNNTQQHNSLKKKIWSFRILALLKNMSWVHFWMSSSTTRAESQMPGAVCQMSEWIVSCQESAVRGRTVKDNLKTERQFYQTLVSDIRVRNQGCFDK